MIGVVSFSRGRFVISEVRRGCFWVLGGWGERRDFFINLEKSS